ncbi:MAG: bifunctional ornithine acetyltransferase/N-acetylglutamate synthase [Eggerthella lenta]
MTSASASRLRACMRLRGYDRLDCALVSADVPCPCAALFTRNAFSAAPVDVSRGHLRRVSFGFVRAVLINSGNANALTGENGLGGAALGKPRVGRAGLPGRRVLVASTGIMGSRPPVEPFECGVLRAGGRRATAATMRPRILTSGAPEGSCRFVPQHRCGVPGCTFTVGGMAKGPRCCWC